MSTNKTDPKDFTQIAGIPSSENIRRDIAENEEDILLAFSRGKDSIATWIALLESGIRPERIHPYHMYGVPDLQFVEDSLKYFEDVFQRRIRRYPHPSLIRILKNMVFQPPEHLATIEQARLREITYEDTTDAIRQDCGISPDALAADGVRSSDSIIRRIAFSRYGAVKRHLKKFSPIWDWKIYHVRKAVEDWGIEWPIDYEWFGRSFDGFDYRFLEPISRHAPEDFQQILKWIPLADMELIRYEL